MSYRVWSSAQVNWVLQRNLQFLEDYLRFASLDAVELVNPAIRAAIETEPGIFLHELLGNVRGVAESDEIYLLIACGKIYVDLTTAAIAEPDRVRVFTNAETAKAYDLAHDGLSNGVAICRAAGGPVVHQNTM